MWSKLFELVLKLLDTDAADSRGVLDELESWVWDSRLQESIKANNDPRVADAAPLMLAALTSPGVEWRAYEFEAHRYCPWCDAAELDGHKADCEYQAAIAAAKPEE